MRVSNLTINTLPIALKKFAPSQSGKMGMVATQGGIEVFAIESCDCCGAEVRGANEVTFQAFPGLLVGLKAAGIVESNIHAEGGCNDNGDFVCPSCY